MSLPTSNVLDSLMTQMIQRVMADYMGVVAITPSNSVSLSKPIRGFVVGANGTVKVTAADGTTATLTCLAGVIYPVICTKVFLTPDSGSIATGIVGIY